jgi:23S rRNA (cytosine1962-C5)-methyltransferase
VRGKRVLDVFTSDGGFALNALYAGAAEVVAIDASKEALKRAQRNAERNGFKGLQVLEGDAFLVLEELVKKGEVFDLVILDPPSLTKSKKICLWRKKPIKSSTAWVCGWCAQVDTWQQRRVRIT